MSGRRQAAYLAGFSVRSFFLLLLVRFWQSVDEGDNGCAAVHAAALVRPAMIVAVQIAVENGLHFLDGLEPSAPAFDAEVLVEERTVQLLDDAVRLWAPNPRGAMLDLLQLQEQAFKRIPFSGP